MNANWNSEIQALTNNTEEQISWQFYITSEIDKDYTAKVNCGMEKANYIEQIPLRAFKWRDLNGGVVSILIVLQREHDPYAMCSLDKVNADRKVIC